VDRMEDIAYVMYTSGSTGLPKGTVLTRRGLLNFYEGVKDPVDYEPGQTSITVTTVSFDIFVCDAILPLLYGSTVVLCAEEELRLPHRVAALIEANDVKFIQATPTRMRILLEDADFRAALSKHIEKIMLGGEMVPPSLLKLVKKYSDARIINAYGPTETTVYSSFRDLTNISHVTIGRPIANTRIYILDSNQRPLPIGALGEAYISGAGVAVGYLNREELNRRVFLPDPYWPGQRMYKTGDVCAFLENGEIEMCGRIDHQIKIRGQRIELGEIEAAIRGIKGVEDAVVKDWGEGINKYLCAYYAESQPVGADTLRAQLLKKLPSYMVPSFFISMEELPMTLNGKVNRKALTEPDKESLNNKKIKRKVPMTGTERKMAKIWARILKTEDIEPEDSFFALGGDSLGVIKVQAAVLQYGWSLRTKDFYESPTLQGICRRINKQNKQTAESPEGESHVYVSESDHLSKAGLRNILLTGSTGYLGAHILEQISNVAGTNIKCLVRGKDAKTCEKYLREVLIFYFGAEACSGIMRHVSVLSGNIALPGFGLNDDSLKMLGGVDTVIHSAAITDHVGQPEVFYNVNVLGTKNAAELSGSLGATLLHVSTYSVSGTYYINDMDRTGEFDESCFYIGQNYTENEYIKSKFIAEEIVLRSVREGLNAKIFRVGLLTGTMDGRFQLRPERNAFANQLKALCSVGCVPLGKLKAKLEMTPVDLCAQAILLLAGTETRMPIFHVFNDNVMTLADVVSLLEQNGYRIEIVSDEEFIQRMRALSRKGSFSELAGLVDDLNADGTAKITVTNDMTRSLLDKAGFHWPEIGADYMGRFINTINCRETKEI
jgi:amino acid adenylation domain-containing protein/thioester reductase-like protein